MTTKYREMTQEEKIQAYNTMMECRSENKTEDLEEEPEDDRDCYNPEEDPDFFEGDD